MGGHFGNIVLCFKKNQRRLILKQSQKSIYLFKDIFQVCLFSPQKYTEQ